MQQIFYITLDPEKALGVESLLPSFHILYSENSQLADAIEYAGIDIKQFPANPESKIHNTAKMLEDSKLQKYITTHSYGKPDVLVFKNDEQITKNSEKNNFTLINPSPLLAKKLENKVEFSKFVGEINIFAQPEYVTFDKLTDLKYAELNEKFGSEFIIQFFFGHSGNSTFFVSNNEDLEDLQAKFPLRKGKVVKKIFGVPYTINACITKLGVIIGGISEQITGIKGLTSSQGGTVGNDFSQRHLNDNLRRDFIEKTEKFGKVLADLGHRGIFGLDVILEENTGTFYLIEANIRQVASCSFASYLQRHNKQVPIMLWHVLELLNHNFNEKFISLSPEDEDWINEKIYELVTNPQNITEYNIKNNQPINASQIFFRNIHNYSVQLKDQFPSGVYRIRGRLPNESAELEDNREYAAIYPLREDGWSHLCLIKRGYNILDAVAEEGFLIMSASTNSIVSPLGELGRLQIMESAFSSKDSDDLNGWIHDVVNAIKENITLVKQLD